jgi:arabinofuranosyltransferase
MVTLGVATMSAGFPAAVVISENLAQDAESGDGSASRGARWGRIGRQLPIALPPLVWLALGWHRRWIADDGLIAARTVREILAGNGPVFNPGERVEVNTSTLWTWLLALITWVTRVDVYRVMVGTGLVLAPLGLVFALLGARRLHRRYRPDALMLPVGALLVLALPPFWDFVTSGLEDSLIFCWLGLCWWLLTGIGRESGRRATWFAFAAGLGWLVRPDMALATAFFLAALWYLTRPGWRRSVLLLVVAGALPAAYQVFRMGYYGLITPNTAVAKDASTMHWSQGLTYLGNFLAPYQLWLPLLLLAILAPLTVGRRLSRPDLVICAAAVLSALVMTLYVVAIGGDFMHARMLLPPTFALMLPVMVLPVPPLRVALATLRTSVPAAACVLAMASWTVVCAAEWRMHQPPAKVPADGIADERAFWVADTKNAHPDTPGPYIAALMGSANDPSSPDGAVVEVLASGQPALIWSVNGKYVDVPLDDPGHSVAIPAFVLGTAGAAVPLDGMVIDQHGLAYALGAHTTAVPDGRPGHSKYVSIVWVLAEYTGGTSFPGISQAELNAARKALTCGGLAELDKATEAPLSFGQFWSNVVHAPAMTSLTFSSDPIQAEKELCG